jgi:transglutaminase-like putative cysteine protease
VIDYIATVHGSREVPHRGESDLLEYRRPSRYCPSDKLLAIAANEFGAIGDDAKLVAAVTTWVHDRLAYTSGSSGPTDDAVDTLLLGAGVCRDYAHLVLSLLRARDVPARLAAVYAPGLDPRTSTPWSRPGWTAHGGWSTPPAWPRGRRCCGSPPAATPRTPRS